jgi:hypothetical protein
MHYPRPAPALRGALLRFVAALAGVSWIRDRLLHKVQKDAGVFELP